MPLTATFPSFYSVQYGYTFWAISSPFRRAQGLAQGFSLEEAAKAAGASKRTLARRMRSVLGKSPLSYFQSLRVERAVHLLKTGSGSVDEVAARVGYADGPRCACCCGAD